MMKVKWCPRVGWLHEFENEGVGIGLWGSEFRVWLGFRVWGFGLRVQASGIRVGVWG